jgi:hypothetical protein
MLNVTPSLRDAREDSISGDPFNLFCSVAYALCYLFEFLEVR